MHATVCLLQAGQPKRDSNTAKSGELLGEFSWVELDPMGVRGLYPVSSWALLDTRSSMNLWMVATKLANNTRPPTLEWTSTQMALTLYDPVLQTISKLFTLSQRIERTVLSTPAEHGLAHLLVRRCRDRIVVQKEQRPDNQTELYTMIR